MQAMYFPILFCMFMAGSVVGLVAHEAGHWAVGRLLGFRIVLVTIGSGAVWYRGRLGAATIELRRFPNVGAVHHVLDRPRGRFSSILLGLGGVGGNILVLALIALITSGPRRAIWDTLAPGLVWAQIFLVFGNLLPWRDKGGESDGYQILRLLFGRRPVASADAARFVAMVEPYRALGDPPPSLPSARLLRACARYEAGADRGAAARALLRELDRGRAQRAETLFVLDKLVTRKLLHGDVLVAEQLDVLSKRAFELAPDIATLRGSRGASLVHLGRHAEGKMLLAPLTEGQPAFDSIVSQLFLARAEHGLGNICEARRLVQAARDALAAQSFEEVERLLDEIDAETKTSSASEPRRQ